MPGEAREGLSPLSTHSECLEFVILRLSGTFSKLHQSQRDVPKPILQGLSGSIFVGSGLQKPLLPICFRSVQLQPRLGSRAGTQIQSEVEMASPKPRGVRPFCWQSEGLSSKFGVCVGVCARANCSWQKKDGGRRSQGARGGEGSRGARQAGAGRLTRAVEARGDGVQEGVLRRQESPHGGHLRRLRPPAPSLRRRGGLSAGGGRPARPPPAGPRAP